MTYWFHHVLVRLVSKTALLEDADAEIDRAMEHGFQQDSRDFRILLFITNALIVFVSTENGITTVSKSDVLNICEKPPELYECEVVSNLEYFEQLKARNSGFIILQNLFHTAAYLSPCLHTVPVISFPWKSRT